MLHLRLGLLFLTSAGAIPIFGRGGSCITENSVSQVMLKVSIQFIHLFHSGMFERLHHLHQGVQQHQHGRVSGEVRHVRSVHLLDLVVGPGEVSALHKLHRTCWRLSGVWEWSQVMWRGGEVSVHHLWRSQQAKWYSDTKWSHGRLSKWTLSSTCLPKSDTDAKTQVTIYMMELLK